MSWGIYEMAELAGLTNFDVSITKGVDVFHAGGEVQKCGSLSIQELCREMQLTDESSKA